MERHQRPLFIGSINGVDHVVHPKQGESKKDWTKRVVSRQLAYRKLKAAAKPTKKKIAEGWSVVKDFDSMSDKDKSKYVFHVTNTRRKAHNIVKGGLKPRESGKTAFPVYDGYTKGKAFVSTHHGVNYWRAEHALAKRQRVLGNRGMRKPNSFATLGVDDMDSKDMKTVHVLKFPVKNIPRSVFRKLKKDEYGTDDTYRFHRWKPGADRSSLTKNTTALHVSKPIGGKKRFGEATLKPHELRNLKNNRGRYSPVDHSFFAPEPSRKHTAFSDHAFGGSQQKRRVIIPLHPPKSKHEPHITKALAGIGFKVKDYHAGLATDKHGRDVKIGKVLAKAGMTKHLTKFNADPSRSQAQAHKDLQVVISRSRADVASQSANTEWHSCMSPDGCNHKYVARDLEHGTHIAYLTKKGDNKARNPLARISLKPHNVEFTVTKYGIEHPRTRKETGRKQLQLFRDVSPAKTKILHPENQVYGNAPDTFKKTVAAWADKHFKMDQSKVYRKGKGLYDDSGAKYKAGKKFPSKLVSAARKADKIGRIFHFGNMTPDEFGSLMSSNTSNKVLNFMRSSGSARHTYLRKADLKSHQIKDILRNGTASEKNSIIGGNGIKLHHLRTVLKDRANDESTRKFAANMMTYAKGGETALMTMAVKGDHIAAMHIPQHKLYGKLRRGGKSSLATYIHNYGSMFHVDQLGAADINDATRKALAGSRAHAYLAVRDVAYQGTRGTSKFALRNVHKVLAKHPSVFDHSGVDMPSVQNRLSKSQASHIVKNASNASMPDSTFTHRLGGLLSKASDKAVLHYATSDGGRHFTAGHVLSTLVDFWGHVSRPKLMAKLAAHAAATTSPMINNHISSLHALAHRIHSGGGNDTLKDTILKNLDKHHPGHRSRYSYTAHFDDKGNIK